MKPFRAFAGLARSALLGRFMLARAHTRPRRQSSRRAETAHVDTPSGFKILSGPTRSSIGWTNAYSWWYLVQDPVGDSPISKWSNPDRDNPNCLTPQFGLLCSGGTKDRGDAGTYTFNATGAGGGLHSLSELPLWVVLPRFPGLDTSK